MILIAAPLHDALTVLEHRRPSHIIDLASPGAEPAPVDGARRLSLRFNDISAPRPGLTLPDEDHVRALLTFAEGWSGDRPLFVYCWAGVSRSTAAAYAIASARSGPGEERALASELRAAAPFATPNPRLVALADGLLGRGGAMIRAVAAIGRGQDAPHGQAFDLNLSAFMLRRTRT